MSPASRPDAVNDPAPARRAGIPGLPSPHPLGRTLPGLYLGDPVTQQLCAALDDVLAPVVSTLDCYAAHLDPATAPADAVDWLASWLGLVQDAHLDEARRRELVRIGSDLLRWRGTVRGLREAVHALFPGSVEIVDPGGVVVLAATATGPDATGPDVAGPGAAGLDGTGPGPAGPGAAGRDVAGPGPRDGVPVPPAPYVLVRLIVDDPTTVDRRRLAATVGQLVPAHVPHRTEVVATGAGGAAPQPMQPRQDHGRPAGG